MTSIPEFGVATPGYSYELRPGAYGVLRDGSGRIAVALTPAGVFLPGRGQKPGEPPEHALRREFAEECGLSIQVGRRIGVADELVFSREEGRGFRKRGTFYEALPCEGRIAGSLEPDHSLVWLPRSEAEARLSHESHRWAVRSLRAGPGAAG
jgi:8-oxo-dGTP pyrophosphatase MutT (NUDIX family)